MHAGSHIASGYRNYLGFSGRTARMEYWVFAGFLMLGAVVLLAIPMLAAAFVLGSALPGLAASVRRLHDTGRTGWWLTLPVIATAGWILIFAASAAAALAVRHDTLDDSRYFLAASAVMLAVNGIAAFWLAQPSQPGSNRYGPNPHEVQQ